MVNLTSHLPLPPSPFLSSPPTLQSSSLLFFIFHLIWSLSSFSFFNPDCCLLHPLNGFIVLWGPNGYWTPPSPPLWEQTQGNVAFTSSVLELHWVPRETFVKAHTLTRLLASRALHSFPREIPNVWGSHVSMLSKWLVTRGLGDLLESEILQSKVSWGLDCKNGNLKGTRFAM